jgi:glutamate synthase (NADPH) large chain
VIFSTQPPAQGLYGPGSEHDACGVAMVADGYGRRSHSIVVDALTALANLEHRGAAGAEPTSGDGAGILLQVPDALLRAEVGFALPEPDEDGNGAYAVGLAFLPVEDDLCAKAVELIERIAAEEKLRVLGWRELPVRACPGSPSCSSPPSRVPIKRTATPH